jgi:tRNA-dihydrouridine synthase B
MFAIGHYEIKNPYILAPMAGVSQMPFRRLALKMGAGLAPTELVSAKGLFFESARTKAYLAYDRHIEKPFCVQLFGGEEEAMAVAAEKAVALGAQIIDINMGCPVKKVTKIHAGSALLCDISRAQQIVSAMLKSTGYKIPITAKIRSGWDLQHLNFLEVGRALQDAGISAIALHPRTRAQGYSGAANWSHIAELKAHLSIPVIGNGDVLSLKDARAMQKETKCDAVMIGRAALGNPWIFAELSQGSSLVVRRDERWRMVCDHLSAHIDLHQRLESLLASGRPFNEMQAIRSFRSHLIWYSKGLVNGSRFRQEIMTSNCPQKTKDLIDEFFLQAEESFDEAHEDGIDYRQAFG